MEGRTAIPGLRCDLNTVRTCFSPIAKHKEDLTPGRTVTKREVLELQLAQPSLGEGVLHVIDKRIPYPILYLLTGDGRCQAWIGYQPAGQGGARVYYHTAWRPQEDLNLELRGLDTDAAYENFVRQIAGEALDAPAAEPLQQTIARDQRRRALEKRIAALQNKICKEKQLNRQVELRGRSLVAYNENKKHRIERLQTIYSSNSR